MRLAVTSIVLIGFLGGVALGEDRVEMNRVSPRRGQGMLFTWDAPGKVKSYTLYVFKSGTRYDSKTRKVTALPSKAMESFTIPGDTVAAWDASEKVEYRYSALKAKTSSGVVWISPVKAKARSIKDAPKGAFGLRGEQLGPPKHMDIIGCVTVPTEEMFFSWDPPRGADVVRYELFLFKTRDFNRRDQQARPEQAIEKYTIPRTAKAAWDNRKEHKYLYAGVLAHTKDGKATTVTGLKAWSEEKGKKPENAHPLFEVKGMSRADLAKFALSEILGELGEIKTETKETLSETITTEIATHPLTYWQQVELIEKAYVPTFLKHKKAIRQAVRKDYPNLKLSPGHIFLKSRVRAQFILALAKELNIAPATRDAALLTVALQVGARKRSLDYKDVDNTVKPDHSFGYLRWTKDGIGVGKFRGAKFYDIVSPLFALSDRLSVKECKEAIAVVDLVVADSPKRSAADALRKKLVDTERYGQAVRIANSMKSIFERNPAAIKVLEEIPNDAHNYAIAVALSARLEKEHKEAVELRKKNQELARKRAEEAAKYRAKFRGALKGEQVQIFDQYGFPNESMPGGGGKTTWVYKTELYSNLKLRHGERLVIGYQVREFVFDAEGVLVSSDLSTQ